MCDVTTRKFCKNLGASYEALLGCNKQALFTASYIQPSRISCPSEVLFVVASVECAPHNAAYLAVVELVVGSLKGLVS